MEAFRLLSFFAITIASLSTTTSCSSKNEVIKIWAWNKNYDILVEAVNNYKTINPNFNAEVVSFSSKDIDTKIKAASSQTNGGSQLADIMLGDAMNMRTYIAQWEDLFVDFSKHGVLQSDEDLFVRSTIELVKYDNNLYAMPYGIGPTVVFAYTPLWNDEVLSDIKTNGWTWNDYISIGNDIKNQNEDAFMCTYNLKDDDRLYRTMTSQYGEWFMDKNLNVQVGNDISVQAVTQIKEMYNSNLIYNYDTGSYTTPMSTGNIAAQIHGFFCKWAN